VEGKKSANTKRVCPPADCIILFLMLAMEGRKKFMSWSRVVLMMVVYVIVNGKTAKVGYHRMVNGKKLRSFLI